ncbi:hypothetical protein Tco_0895985 [Tanacetum coccineum]|uniref:Uncharacterized protein n=1 Tax=Tanacetum coccineum TaxID=301880 RepID=A0ABQ5CH78_9ASTR
MEILLEPTSNKLMVDVPVMRTTSIATKPCQEDSSEFYLITGSIYTDQRGTVVFPTMAAARRGRVRFIAACSYSTDIHKDIMKAQSEIKIIKRFQPRQPDDDAQFMFLGAEPYHFEYDHTNSTKLGDSGSVSGLRSMLDDDLVSLTGFETPESADNDSQRISCTIFNTKVDQLESRVSKKVTDDVQSSVPSILAEPSNRHP